jgi:hypothetical protein
LEINEKLHGYFANKIENQKTKQEIAMNKYELLGIIGEGLCTCDQSERLID